MSEEERFKKYFIDSLHANMDMEHEAIYTKKELYDRYRVTIEALVDEGVYKGLSYK